MAESAIRILQEELKEKRKGYKDLFPGAEYELLQLNYDLNLTKAFVRDADSRLKKNEAFKVMERQICEVVYDVEDAIDRCLAEAKGKNIIRRKFSASNLKLATVVKSIRVDKVKPLLQRIHNVFDVLRLGAATYVEQPPTRPIKDQPIVIRTDKFVGFKDEENKLLRYLWNEGNNMDVISIIGMPGLGKTTLARKIFESYEIRINFSCRIWVYISQSFNSRDVFLNILRNFTENDMSGLSDEDLAKSVREYLSKEKFFLVMDDVWSPEVWKVMQNVLPNTNIYGKRNSKVMITSTERGVGVHAKVRTDPLMLRFFRLEESWELLQLEVFGSERECPEDLKGIGKKLAHQCSGVPLAVVVLGGILAGLSIKTERISILKKEWENVSERWSKSIQNDEWKLIFHIVESSYNRLPDYLRECFLYMAVFPEDHVISAWMLTRLWIAEGFIQPKKGFSPEEVAKEYLGDLVSRNLLMLDQINSIGEIKTCRVPDMIRRFCRERAMEQIGFQEIMINRDGVFEPSISEVQHFRRLCFHSDLTKFFSKRLILSDRFIRSFLCFYKEPVNLEPSYISAIPEAFPLLRVLESISIKFDQFPGKVTKLIHLRYLTLHIYSLSMLPETLSELWNLQTLIVESNSRSIIMKANIWKMYRLRHLKMKAAIVLDPKWDGPKWDGEGGENLQTLSVLAPESCTHKLSERAYNLKELGVRGKLATFFSKMSMGSLGRLEKLKLINDLGRESEILSGLPRAECFPPHLMRLTLSNTSLGWKHISTLAEIRTLEVLKLKENAFIGIYWDAMHVCFPNLSLLLIVNTDLVQWKVSPNSFPKLKHLVLKNCENLNEIPMGLAETLEKLDIARLRKSAVDSALRIEEGRKQAEEVGKVELKFQFNLSIGGR